MDKDEKIKKMRDDGWSKPWSTVKSNPLYGK